MLTDNKISEKIHEGSTKEIKLRNLAVVEDFNESLRF